MLLSRLRAWLRKVPPRWWAILAECNLLGMGIALMGLDLAYFPKWLYNMQFGDFYTYLSLTGLISVWSIFGIIATATSWYPGVKAYAIGLVILSTIQIAFGVVHVVLLFTLYRQTLLDRCANRGADALFWWSLQREDDPETRRLLSECNSKWAHFALERVLTWALYSAGSVLSMFIIRNYYRELRKTANRTESIDEDQWPSDEKPIAVTTHRQPSRKKEKRDKKRRKHQEAAVEEEAASKHVDELPPPSYSETQEQERIQDEMYKQRQKLYAEICKHRETGKKQQKEDRNRASSSSSRKSSLPGGGGGPVHPLDLTTHDPENEYTPPSPPPAVRKGDPFSSTSAEKTEYNRYRSNSCEESLLVPAGNQSQERRESAPMSRRRGKPSQRWSRLNPDEEKEMEPMLQEPEQVMVPRNNDIVE